MVCRELQWNSRIIFQKWIHDLLFLIWHMIIIFQIKTAKMTISVPCKRCCEEHTIINTPGFMRLRFISLSCPKLYWMLNWYKITWKIITSKHFPHDWTALHRDAAHSLNVVRRSKCSVSPVCHNRVTWLATSAQQLMLLAVVGSKSLGQAPLPWCHYHIMAMSHSKLCEFPKSDKFSNVTPKGEYWLHVVFFT